MTRPLVPRLPQPWRPRPLMPLLALLALAVCVAASAGAGLRAGARDSVPVAAVSHSVQMANFAFAPQTLTIAAGDSVTWTNQDEAPHTVTTTSGPRSISSPMLSKGQSLTYTFAVPGTYSYYCTVHPDMRAQIVVTAAAPPPSPTRKPSTKPSSAAPPQPTLSAAGGVAHVGTQAMSHSGGDTASSAASGAVAPASSESPAGSETPAPAQGPVQAPAPDAAAASPGDGGRRLDPALVLAGLTAGVTVFCLFLVASRRNDES